ncbi:LptA/OstA family protein [Gimibacter soli]|uniref:LptA/OstA family protein n=1 Tax=Gimibacter soli TaxID=3024400 RepID=A0AAE9XQN2_9PROT|nr:LptA/OstA family protein [Gimibacter soli]WCL54514.1 LptA/OstA family protein [Gimibacter soli]
MMRIRHALIAALLPLASAAGAAAAEPALKGHDTEQPIDITAERLEVRQRDGRAEFKGAVRVVQGGMTLTADSLVVYYAGDIAGGSPSISRLDSSGKVSLSSDSEAVTGDWAIYDVEKRLVTMGGNVVLTRGSSRLAGERLELDLVSGLTRLDGAAADDGRVRGRFSLPEKQPES